MTDYSYYTSFFCPCSKETAEEILGVLDEVKLATRHDDPVGILEKSNNISIIMDFFDYHGGELDDSVLEDASTTNIEFTTENDQIGLWIYAQNQQGFSSELAACVSSYALKRDNSDEVVSFTYTIVPSRSAINEVYSGAYVISRHEMEFYNLNMWMDEKAKVVKNNIPKIDAENENANLEKVIHDGKNDGISMNF